MYNSINSHMAVDRNVPYFEMSRADAFHARLVAIFWDLHAVVFIQSVLMLKPQE